MLRMIAALLAFILVFRVAGLVGPTNLSHQAAGFVVVGLILAAAFFFGPPGAQSGRRHFSF